MSELVALSLGLDPVLPTTRNQVLTSTGITVMAAHSVNSALALFLAGDFDMVVVCPTIHEADRKYLITLCHHHSPSTPVIVVSDGFESEDIHADVITGNDPRIFVQDVRAIAFHWGA